ncbi:MULTISPECIES: HalOD1 output domain-containing protein [Salinibaculum]|uniref:HalOD1 output domain-containing protein n=1 Tax=Salinibaculum TaxID=2732368 RepID=UPI0030CF2C58
MESPPVARRVVTNVADTRGVRPTELTPISDAIDPESLDTLFPAPTDSTRTLQFAYEGYQVTVDHDGAITVRPLPE